MPKSKSDENELKGWQEISAFLGQPVSVAQRWADSGMPIEKRRRYVYSSRDHLNQWLRQTSAGEPVQIATEETNLGAELKKGLKYFRRQSQSRKKKTAA